MSQKWEEVGGRVIRPRVVEDEGKALRKLKEVLERQVEEMKRNRTKAREHLHRMRHGGGS